MNCSSGTGTHGETRRHPPEAHGAVHLIEGIPHHGGKRIAAHRARSLQSMLEPVNSPRSLMNRGNPEIQAWRIQCRNDEHVIQEGARVLLDAFIRAGERDFAIALSGGRSAPGFYAELIRQSGLRRCSLAEADYFWADERCVPPDHKESNYRLAHEGLLEPLKVASSRIHRLPGELAPERAVENAIGDWIQWAERRGPNRGMLDAVVLGMGEDGHVASLFPQNLDRDLQCLAPFCAVTGPKPPPERLTVSYRVLWEASLVIVLVTGAGKAEILEKSLNGSCETPLARVLRGRTNRESIVVAVRA
jgi:6-phosphogluconolactonase